MTFVILYIRNDNSIRFQPIVIITIYQYQSNETKILNKIKKSKNPKTRKGLKKKDHSVSIILSLHLFAVYLHIHTWNDTKRLLSCTFFFVFL